MQLNVLNIHRQTGAQSSVRQRTEDLRNLENDSHRRNTVRFRCSAFNESRLTMTHALPKKCTRMASWCVLAIGAACGAAWPVANRTDAADINAQRSPSSSTDYGLCWHVGMGPALVCDPNFVAPSSTKVAESITSVLVMTEMTKEVIPTFVSERVTLHADALFYTALTVERGP
jgi:hypothetical protein